MRLTTRPCQSGKRQILCRCMHGGALRARLHKVDVAAVVEGRVGVRVRAPEADALVHALARAQVAQPAHAVHVVEVHLVAAPQPEPLCCSCP